MRSPNPFRCIVRRPSVVFTLARFKRRASRALYGARKGAAYDMNMNRRASVRGLILFAVSAFDLFRHGGCSSDSEFLVAT
jgi:hypothetical protein